MTERPALLLVHGAWHGPWCWEPLKALLENDGWRVGTVDLPSVAPATAPRHGMYDDASAVRAAIEEIGGPVVVVAHSYGGIPVTEGAAGLPGVEHLVYVAAFQIDVGDSLLSTIGGTPPPWWQVDGEVIRPLTPETVFFNDVGDAPVDRLETQSYAAVTDRLTQAAWHTVGSTYVVCENDNAIPVFAQDAMAQRATSVQRLPPGHSPFLSRPAELAAIITTAAVTLPRRSSPASG
ncbi:alpha/beta fold hydrolase [Lentzea sp. NPDC051213]|uniref:alpha/beta fold hydrolase n=1 Tax=Lentzea sp. NPDC051213 TaxID=3364126 RepID=UPI0037BDAB0C